MMGTGVMMMGTGVMMMGTGVMMMGTGVMMMGTGVMMGSSSLHWWIVMMVVCGNRENAGTMGSSSLHLVDSNQSWKCIRYGTV